MEIEQFKREWQRQPVERDRHDGVADDVRGRVERLHRTVRRRDIFEASVAIVGILVFARLFWMLRNPTARAGAAILVISAAVTMGRLYAARHRGLTRQVDRSVVDFCRMELEAVDAQIQMLRSVLWWYVAPVLVGANLVYAGLSTSTIGTLVYAAATLAAGAVIYQLNQRAVGRELVPLRLRLDRALSELQADPSTDRGE